MPRPKSQSFRIPVKIPAGVKVGMTILKQAATAANRVLSEKLKFQVLSQQLAAHGVAISPDQLERYQKPGNGSKAAPKVVKKRRRTVLSAGQRKVVLSKLQIYRFSAPKPLVEAGQPFVI